MYGMENSKDLATGSSLRSFMNGQVPGNVRIEKDEVKTFYMTCSSQRQILASVHYVNYISPPADEFGAVDLFFVFFIFLSVGEPFNLVSAAHTIRQNHF